VETGEVEESVKAYFCAKAWALLHVPPHKMWALSGALRLTGKGLEEEALEVWRRLGLNDVFGDPAKCKRVVERASGFASSPEKWIIDLSFAGVDESFEYNKLHNMFNLNQSTQIRQLQRQELEDVIRQLVGKLRSFATDPRKFYHALYALYEVEWAARKLPPSLADTRLPTYTVFDHVYATALAVNLLWPDEEVGGYAVMVDIPGIQQVVGAARKAGDFWAGSWMISAVTWLTLWPFVWEFGADTLLKPSPRYNPYYYATLWAQLGSDGKLWSSFEKLYSSLHLGVPSSFKPQHAIRQPVIPGTATLILPKVRPSGQRLERSSLEREVREKFEKAFELIQMLASGGSGVSEELYAAFFNLLGGGATSAERAPRSVVKMFTIIRKNEPKAFEGLLRPRVCVVDVGELYSEWLKVVKGEAEPEEKEARTSNILRGLATAREKLAKLGVNEVEAAEKLTQQALIALLSSELRSRVDKELVVPKAWFTLEDRKLKPVISFGKFYDSDFEKIHDKGRDIEYKYIGYITCSVCGNEPAVLRLSKVTKPGATDYSDGAREMLEKLGFAKEDIDDLKVWVKPGEALGPLCLTKRALYALVKDALGLGHESTEDVAFSFVAEELSGLADYLGESGDEGKVKNFIDKKDRKKVKSFETMLDPNAERARALYERVLRELVERDPEARKRVSDSTRMLSERLSRIYGVEGFEAPIDFLTSFRSYYCLLRADADNIGKLSGGEVRESNYSKLLRKPKEEAEKRGEAKLAEAFERAVNYTDVLLSSLKGAILKEATNRELVFPSPIYSLALSTAMMVAALKGVMTIEYDLNGAPIFSGGDDDLALLPVETGLAAVERLRAIYHGEEGFHRIGDYVVPALSAYGKSFSLRLASILDLMSEEIAESARLLEEVAKEVKWESESGEPEKDTLVLSDSRGGGVAVLPLGDGLWSLKALEAMWIARLSGLLSANLPEDYELMKEAVEAAATTGKWDLAVELMLYVLRRNTPQRKLEGGPLEKLELLVGELEQLKAVGEVPAPYGEKPGERVRLSALSWLVEAFRVVRRYP